MKTMTSFLVAGAHPLRDFYRMVIDHRILRSRTGLAECILGSQALPQGKSLVLVDRQRLMDLQERQKVQEIDPPFSPIGTFESQNLRVLLATKVLSSRLSRIELEEHEQSIIELQSTLRQIGISHLILPADQVGSQVLEKADLLVIAGGDGTFLKVARLVNNDLPILGVNSAPSQSFAHYLKVKSRDFEAALTRLLKGDFSGLKLPRIFSSLDSREQPLALNDLFIKDLAPAKVTRTLIRLSGLEEFLYCDGLLISAASATQQNSWMNNADAGGIFLGSGSPLMQVLAFNANKSDRAGNPSLLRHFVAEGGFEIESANRHNPALVLDGEREAAFQKGSRLYIAGTGQPISLVVFPERTEAARGSMPEINSAQIAGMTPRLIEELDQMPLLKSVAPGEKMQVLLLRITEDLNALGIYSINKYGGRTLNDDQVIKVAEISKPTLLYPTAEIAALPSTTRDLVLNLFRYGNYVVEMAGVLTEWNATQDKNVWGPSIDTAFLLYALRKHGLFNDRVRKAAEIGTGSGMLAKSAAKLLPNLEQLEITDIELRALSCAERNIRVDLKEGIYLAGIHAPGIKKIGKMDLIFVNPPYVPKPRADERNPYEGTGLLREIINEGLEHLNPDNPEASIVINYSSLAQKDVDAYLQGRKDLKIEYLENLTVPLKINWTQIDAEWLNYLITECGLEVRDESMDGYKYWHTLRIIKISKK